MHSRRTRTSRLTTEITAVRGNPRSRVNHVNSMDRSQDDCRIIIIIYGTFVNERLQYFPLVNDRVINERKTRCHRPFTRRPFSSL